MDESKTEKRHPIQVVSRRTGLSTEVLRAWERRYGVVRPGRTEAGRRIYSDADVERLRLLRQATHAGRPISQVAPLTLDELEALVKEDRVAEATVPPLDARISGAARSHLNDCLEAMSLLDGGRLERALGRAAIVLPPTVLIEEVVTPLMRRVGELWNEERLTPAYEHVASGAVRTTLSNLTASIRRPTEAPNIVTATPSGQHHEIGALLAATAAAAQGWCVTHLGTDLPGKEVAAAARKTQSRAVALSLIYPEDDPTTHEELQTLRRMLADDTVIIVGGQASASYERTLENIGATVLQDALALSRVLRALVEAGSNGRPQGA